jgi:hypothetical protein
MKLLKKIWIYFILINIITFISIVVALIIDDSLSRAYLIGMLGNGILLVSAGLIAFVAYLFDKLDSL